MFRLISPSSGLVQYINVTMVGKFTLKKKVLHQYNETNMMHLSFNLLRIKGLYMFQALLTYPQEALHKRHLLYCFRIMSDVAQLQ
jgi:hypothetical protein